MRVSRSVPHFLNDDKRWKEDVGGWGNGRPFAFFKKTNLVFLVRISALANTCVA